MKLVSPQLKEADSVGLVSDKTNHKQLSNEMFN